MRGRRVGVQRQHVGHRAVERARDEERRHERTEGERREPFAGVVARRRREARELRRHRHPGRILLEPREIRAAQARSASGHDERTDRDRSGLANHGEMRAVGGEVRQIATRGDDVVADLDDERRRPRIRMREIGVGRRHRDAMPATRELPAEASCEADTGVGGAQDDRPRRFLDVGDRHAHPQERVDELLVVGIQGRHRGGHERSRRSGMRSRERDERRPVGAVARRLDERMREGAVGEHRQGVDAAEAQFVR